MRKMSFGGNKKNWKKKIQKIYIENWNNKNEDAVCINVWENIGKEFEKFYIETNTKFSYLF